MCSSNPPASRPPWPNRAACWSPAMPAMGTAAPSHAGVGSADDARRRAQLGQHRARARRRAPAVRRPSPAAWMSSSMVRDALLKSVTWRAAAGEAPHQEAVDGAGAQAPAAQQVARRRAGCCSSHSSLVALKYGSRRRPVSAATRGPQPGGLELGAPRPRSAGTATRWRSPEGAPVSASHSSTVSRWLAMPTAARSPASQPGLLEGLPAAAKLRGPDVLRVVLHPARLRGSAGRTAPAPSARMLPVAGEDDGPGAGGPLVDGHDARDCRVSCTYNRAARTKRTEPSLPAGPAPKRRPRRWSGTSRSTRKAPGRTGAIGVLLIHGFGGSPRSLQELAGRLVAAGYTVALPLLAGHGRTPEDMEASRWTEWTADVEKAYDWLRARTDRVFVCGLSMGGHAGSVGGGAPSGGGRARLHQQHHPASRWRR